MKTEAMRISSEMAEFIKGIKEIKGFSTMAEAAQYLFDDYIELKCNSEIRNPDPVISGDIVVEEVEAPPVEMGEDHREEGREAKLQLIQEDVKASGLPISVYMDLFTQIHGNFVRTDFIRKPPQNMKKINKFVQIIQNGRGF